jgi:hypothetical protein
MKIALLSRKRGKPTLENNFALQLKSKTPLELILSEGLKPFIELRCLRDDMLSAVRKLLFFLYEESLYSIASNIAEIELNMRKNILVEYLGIRDSINPDNICDNDCIIFI